MSLIIRDTVLNTLIGYKRWTFPGGEVGGKSRFTFCSRINRSDCIWTGYI